MKSIKQLPLLATTAAMALLAISGSADWIRITAIIVGLASLIIFIKSNFKKS